MRLVRAAQRCAPPPGPPPPGIRGAAPCRKRSRSARRVRDDSSSDDSSEDSSSSNSSSRAPAPPMRSRGQDSAERLITRVQANVRLFGRMQSNGQVAAAPVDSQSWRERERLRALLGSCPRSLGTITAAAKSWFHFAENRLHRSGDALAPDVDGLLVWSGTFKSAGTFSNYVSALRTVCEARGWLPHQRALSQCAWHTGASTEDELLRGAGSREGPRGHLEAQPARTPREALSFARRPPAAITPRGGPDISRAFHTVLRLRPQIAIGEPGDHSASR